MIRNLLIFCSAITLSVTAHAQQTKPNIIVILADDLGLGDISHHHRAQNPNTNPLVETPNIDALARAGMWFRDAHSPTALCAPSRYALMTGNYNYHSARPAGVWSAFDPNAIRPSDTTLGRITKAAGYRTGFVGKWHLGGDFRRPDSTQLFRGTDHKATPMSVDLSNWIDGGPRSLGFDFDYTLPTGVQGPVYVVFKNGVWERFQNSSELIYFDSDTAIDSRDTSDKGPGIGDSHWLASSLARRLVDNASEFISKNAPSDAPFFLYYSSPAVHIPHTPPAKRATPSSS